MSLISANDPSEPSSTRDTPNIDSSAGQDHVAPLRRIPHLGHALVFISFTGVLLILLELICAALGRASGSVHGGVTTLLRPKLQIALLATTYLTTLLAAWFVFPHLWQRRFLDGIEWRWATARSQAAKLLALGLVVGMMMQVVAHFITPPKTLPIDEFFLTPLDAWLITIFGTILAPVFEEICFRGFMVPAFAIAYDWLSLPRTEEARSRWQTTTTLTPAALIFSSLLTSLIFALLHATQVAHLWNALLVLFTISLLLTWVRLKSGSVAASALVHGAYNGFVFLMVMVQTGGYRHLERMTQ
jgi:membrane protease YdiL (CAAX protease family)